MVRQKFLILFVAFAVFAYSMADHSDSDSSDDHHKDEHSGDVVGKNKDKKSGKKEEKTEEKAEEADEDDEEAHWSDADIDAMFGDKPESTVKPAEGEQAPTTASPPLGVFGNGWSSLWGNGDDDDKDDTLTELLAGKTTVSPPTSGKDDSKDGKDSSPTSGNNGSPFYPIPRPIDIWDRLFVLAAFPICFFAVMLKAEMFR